jgi:hypothetical protein
MVNFLPNFQKSNNDVDDQDGRWTGIVVSLSYLTSYLLPQKKLFVYNDLRRVSCPEGRTFLPRRSNQSAQTVVYSCPDGRTFLPGRSNESAQTVECTPNVPFCAAATLVQHGKSA